MRPLAAAAGAFLVVLSAHDMNAVLLAAAGLLLVAGACLWGRDAPTA